MRLGIHVSISGGLPKAAERAQNLGCQTFQIFSRSPRGGKARAFPPAELGKFRELLSDAEIDPVVIHVPYYINLASPRPELRHDGLELLCEDLDRAGQLGGKYLVTHTGKHLGAGESQGVDWVAEAVAGAISQVDNDVVLLVENMSGAGTEVGYTWEHLAVIMSAVDSPRLGICLDTCHAFAAGYDLRNSEDVGRFISGFDRVVGLKRLGIIHANDSLFPYNSRKDRHMHIGKGHIGLEGFRSLVNHQALRQIPFILETPESDPGDDVRNLETLRSLAGG